MSIKAIPEETLANIRRLITPSQSGGGVIERLMGKPLNTAIETPALAILKILQELNDSISDPETNISQIQKLMEKFNEEVKNISHDENLRNDPQLKNILQESLDAISILRSDPLFMYYNRIRNMKDNIHGYTVRAANNKIAKDIQDTIEITRNIIAAHLNTKLQESSESWFNPARWFRRNKISDTSKNFDEELEKMPDYEKANLILENISETFTSLANSPASKAIDAANYELLFELRVKHIDSAKIHSLLTDLKNAVIHYDFIEKEKTIGNKLETIVETQIQKKFKEFEKTPLGAYVIAKRAFDEKFQSLNAKLHKSPDDSRVLEDVQDKMNALKAQVKGPAKCEIKKAKNFNFAQKNEFDLLSLMLPGHEFRAFSKQVQNALLTELRNEFPAPELPRPPTLRQAW